MTRSSQFRPDVQGIRAIAVLLVVLYHAGDLIDAGFIGVDMFFVISGFVIMGSVQRGLATTNSFSVLNFLGRRVRRLFPALAVMVGITMLMTPWLAPISSLTQTMRTGLFSSVSAANLFLYRFRPDGYFEVAEKTNPLLHMWSLSIEEQFYVGFAVLLALIALIIRARPSTRLLITTFSLIGTISFVLCAYLGSRSLSIPQTLSRIVGSDALDSDFNFYLPLTRAWEFIVGMLLAFVPASQSQWSRVRSGLALLLLVMSVVLISDQDRFPGLITVIPVALTVVLIGSAPIRGPLGAMLASRTMVYVGDRSYSWYLWHWPIIQFVRPVFPESRLALVVAAIASFAPAMISYRHLELRFMHRTLPARQTAGLALAPMVIAAIAFAAPFKPFSELGLHLDAERGCESGDPALVARDSRCTIGVSGSRGQAVLLGDSHAGQLSEGFVLAAHQLKLDATIAVRAGKPLLARSSLSMEFGDDELVDAVVASKPSVVVIAQSRYPSLLPEGSSWQQLFAPLIDYFSAQSIPVIVINTSSIIGIEPKSCSWLSIQLGRCGSETSAPRTQVEAAVSVTLNEERAALSILSRNPVSLLDVFCDDQECASRRNGKWMWRDSSHMSRYASELIAPLLRDAMYDSMTTS